MKHHSASVNPDNHALSKFTFPFDSICVILVLYFKLKASNQDLNLSFLFLVIFCLLSFIFFSILYFLVLFYFFCLYRSVVEYVL